MANQIQMVMYEGYLAEDPEMRFTPSGKPVTNFRMGSTRQYKDAQGETVKETTWLKVTAWNKLGEIVNNYCGKGSHVIVTGILRGNESGNPSVYTRNNGEAGASFEITASEVRILKAKDGAFANRQSETLSDDELPF